MRQRTETAIGRWASVFLFTLVLMFAYEAIRFNYSFHDTINKTTLIASFLVFLIIRMAAGNGWACAFGYLTSLMVLIDFHLGTRYDFLFAALGKQLIFIIRATNQSEIRAYLKVISYPEYLAALCLSAAWFVAYWVGRSRSRGHGMAWWARLSLAALVIPCFFYSYHYRFISPLLDYLNEARQNADVLRRYDQFSFHAVDRNQGDAATYVILIGETHRYDHFHVFGYARDNTPQLDQLKTDPGFFGFSDMISGYPMTQMALPVILTRKPIADHQDLFDEKSIISAFKEAGFKTYYLSYLYKAHPAEDNNAVIVAEADTYIKHAEPAKRHDDPGYLPDDDAGFLPDIDTILQNGDRRRLLVIKMVGVHFHFQDRFPKSFEKFTPSFASEPMDLVPAKKDVLINTYDNAIYYSESIIARIARRVQQLPSPALMTFLSDHGTALFDEGNAVYTSPVKGTFHIPFFILGNSSYLSTADPQQLAHLQCNRDIPMTQEYVFETFLRLSHVEYPGYRPNLDLSSACLAGEPNRHVWTLDGRRLLYSDLPGKP
jgi:glucan phosphoethanolaminetransferase (alkaline phosphatase superfamily)